MATPIPISDSYLELQAGFQFAKATPVLVTPSQTLAQVPPGQAVLHLPRRQENLNINTVRVRARARVKLSNLLHQIFKLIINCMKDELYISLSYERFSCSNCTTATTI